MEIAAFWFIYMLNTEGIVKHKALPQVLGAVKSSVIIPKTKCFVTFIEKPADHLMCST